MIPAILRDAMPDMSMINVSPEEVRPHPYPHVIKQPFIQPDFYRRLKAEFPSDSLFVIRPRGVGRTGRDFFEGDPEFSTFLAKSQAWSEFHNYFSSESFLRFAFGLFGPYLETFGCRVGQAEATLVDYTESRLSLWRHKWLQNKVVRRLFGRHNNLNHLFTRFDIEQAAEGYDKPVHCDWPNRWLSMIVYFCDADEIGMDGGDLRIHEHIESKPYPAYERHPKEQQTRIIQTVRPRENLGLIFLCSNNSYHSVTKVRTIRDYRRFIYLNVSSMADSIW